MAFTTKVKKLIKQRTFLFTLSLTILGFICVPLLAMQSFVIERSTEEFQATNQQYYVSVLQASANTFLSREQILSNTGLRISLNETVQKPLRHNATEYSLYEAAQALIEYSREIMYAKNAGVFYTSEGFLLTNGCKYTLRDYCEKIEPTDAAQADRMEAFFSELKSLGYYATSDGSTLFIARPISLGSVARNDSIVFFAMDATALEESYRASISLHSSFAVVDKQGNFLLMGNDFTENIQTAALSDFLSSDSVVCVAGAEDELLLYKYTDPESDFTFVLSVDKDESEERLVDFAQLVRTTMYAMIILVTVSLAATIYINYRPIHRILKKHASSDTKHAFSSELEILDSAFFKLDEKMSAQQNLLKDFIVGDLLFGNTAKSDLVNQYFPADRYCSFAVATVLCPTLTTVQSHQLANIPTEASGHSIYVTSAPNRPHTVIVCIGETSVDPIALRVCIVSATAQTLGAEYPVRTGEVVTDIYELRTSYRSAAVSNLPTTTAESHANSEEFAKELQLLSQCVYVGDEVDALHHLAEIKNYLYRHIKSEGVLRYYCFELLRAYLNGINSSEAPLSDRSTELLLSFTSTEHLFELLTESIHQVCSQVADVERTMDAQLQQRLLQYVDQNFTDSSLCLTTAADHMGISIYTVSRLFKEVTGTGFKDYIVVKRLEYGHTLLCTTTKSIAEVSAAAGFDNANYFSTIFKAKYGMPPTKYRRNLKENQTI